MMMDYIVAQVCLIVIFIFGFSAGYFLRPKRKSRQKITLDENEQRQVERVKREISNMLNYDGTEQEDVAE